MNRAEYALCDITGGFIIIDDLGRGKTVTNDAEAVVKECVAKWGDQRIRYWDTDRTLSELVHWNGTFIDYLAINPNTDRIRVEMIERHIKGKV